MSKVLKLSESQLRMMVRKQLVNEGAMPLEDVKPLGEVTVYDSLKVLDALANVMSKNLDKDVLPLFKELTFGKQTYLAPTSILLNIVRKLDLDNKIDELQAQDGTLFVREQLEEGSYILV